MKFDRTVCADFHQASGLEWLETNGLGGFASSTILGLHTRRYHGLLTAALKPPVGRTLLLSNLEETLIVDGRPYELSAHRYPGVVHPRGFEHLHEFRLDPFPSSVYRAADAEIEKRVFMVHGENTTVIQYDLRGGGECVLEVRPLLAFRDYHATTHRNGAINAAYDAGDGLVCLRPYSDMPPLFLAHDATATEATGNWYLNFEYDREQERGLDYQEDLFNPLALRFSLGGAGGRTGAVVIASTAPARAADASEYRAREAARRRTIVQGAPCSDPLVEALTAAADAYIVRRGANHSIIAGYPWFSDWGRDTMIALPGLTLTTGRYEVARGILSEFAAAVDGGMLPNRFPDAGENPEYNTVDATLWFFEAVRGYLEHSGDAPFVKSEILPVLKHIVNAHLKGTRYGIRADRDGLLRCGEPGVQLTWMDAKIGDWVVTPRSGKPVEIQALWYNALRVMEDLCRRFGDEPSARFLQELAGLARESFEAKFWNEAEGCLYDVVDDVDASIRPNQILAVSLPHTMLSQGRANSVVATVERELLTPLGLRSLSPRDSRYRPEYRGGVFERDSAYHQGTVWPWLMGPFITAYVKVHDGSAPARERAQEWLQPFVEHLREGALGQVSEVADGDAPHRAGGCFAQAWSVAELLRAAVDDVFRAEPRRLAVAAGAGGVQGRAD